ncbi:MAG: GerMN domain-containing protein [Clostridia bacterium]|nr:GerMN domain-containing protein [Clostridia bacterium]
MICPQSLFGNQNNEGLKLAIYSIVNTLTELNDVNGVKFIIDGEEGKEVSGTEIHFKSPFVRQDSII